MINLLTKETDHPVLTLKCIANFSPLKYTVYVGQSGPACINMMQSTADFVIDMVI